MTDTTKMVLMIKAALCEKQGIAECLRITNYQKKDYILLHGVLGWAAATAAYLLIVLLWLVYVSGSDSGTYLLNQLPLIGAAAAAIYVVFCVLYLIYTVQVYRKRYEDAEKIVSSYKKCLKDIQREGLLA